MVQTYISATLGNMVAQSVMRGLNVNDKPLDLADSVLSGMQVGTAFIAYPVSVQLLKDVCPAFKKNAEDPNGNKWITYTLGGAGGAAIVTLLNYPISRFQMARRTGTCPIKNPIKEMASMYIDQVGSSIGFAATMGTVAPLIPIPKDSLGSWARNSGLVQISNIGGKVFAYPIHKIRHGSSLCGMIGGYLKGALGVCVTGDSTAHFKNVLAFIA